jgi:hypothetical protein
VERHPRRGRSGLHFLAVWNHVSFHTPGNLGFLLLYEVSGSVLCESPRDRAAVPFPNRTSNLLTQRSRLTACSARYCTRRGQLTILKCLHGKIVRNRGRGTLPDPAKTSRDLAGHGHQDPAPSKGIHQPRSGRPRLVVDGTSTTRASYNFYLSDKQIRGIFPTRNRIHLSKRRPYDHEPALESNLGNPG